jgi:hypothetical protein
MGSRRSTLGSRVSVLYHTIAPRILSRTGAQLMLEDDAEKPLLLRMSEPGTIALLRFVRLIAS